MRGFARFPSIPYLVRPSGVDVRDDKVLTQASRDEFLARALHVEEKIDGQNLGISTGEQGLQFQARGSYVEPGGRHFRGLATWVDPRRQRLEDSLGQDLVLFGEWCSVTHTVTYDSLPDWFLVFDVYERSTNQFWEPELRDALTQDLGLHTVPFLGAGHFDVEDLTHLMADSRVGREPMEGVVARSVPVSEEPTRAKLVRPGFVQAIDTHWMAGEQAMNRLTTDWSSSGENARLTTPR